MHHSYYLLWGFLIWLLATLAVRVAGQFLLQPDSVFMMSLLYLATIPVIAAVTYPVYRWQNLNSDRRKEAAMLFVLPGILLDAFVVLGFARAFPNVTGQADGLFGAWLLWAYGLALLTGFFPRARVP